MEVFVHIKGFLKDPKAHPEYGGAEYLSHKFTARHQDPATIAGFINSAVMEVLAVMGAMIVPKNADKSTQGIEGFNNLRVWPRDHFKFFEIETKTISASTPVPDLDKIERVHIN